MNGPELNLHARDPLLIITVHLLDHCHRRESLFHLVNGDHILLIETGRVLARALLHKELLLEVLFEVGPELLWAKKIDLNWRLTQIFGVSRNRVLLSHLVSQWC